MNIFEITDQIRTNEDAIQFLRDRGILRSLDNPPICYVCGECVAPQLSSITHFSNTFQLTF